MIQQLTLYGEPLKIRNLPTTRYQGSKSKIAPWIWDNIKSLKFNSALDAFGGTGVIGYLLKTKGKQVFYNDILKFNYYIGVALIENNSTKLSKNDIEFLLNYHTNINYGNFIQETFRNIYYTDNENKWLDMVIANIMSFDDFYKKRLLIMLYSNPASLKDRLICFTEKIYMPVLPMLTEVLAIK